MKKVFKKIIKAVKNPSKIIVYLSLKGFSKFFSDKFYIKHEYKSTMCKKLNLKTPQTYSEKLQWLKLYDRKPEYTTMVDKAAVKEYVAEKIGPEYIIQTIGVYDKFEDIDFDALPNQFVIKCTHDSGGLVICKDKSKFDIKKAEEKIKWSQKRKYFWIHREWPYKNVKPRIIVEKFLDDGSGKDLNDYKVFNFCGEPYYIQVDMDRFVNHQKNMYTTEWTLCDYSFNYPSNPQRQVSKPEKLDEILQISRVLSKEIPYLRTDFYVVNDKIYFGELTFFPASGFGKFDPEEYDKKLGDLIKLPKKD